jgi:hypothetical protein
MKNLDFGRCALGICAAAAMLAGCGGSQPPVGSTGAMPQTSALATHADRGTSWMAPEAKNEDLLYVAGGGSPRGWVRVYSYPQSKLVGKITGLDLPYGECVDRTGDVWVITNFLDTATEYAHGGTTPIATLSVPGSNAYACAVDPTTGNLAVTNTSGVSIFPDAQGTPTTYTDWGQAYFCTYDDDGNLFALTGDELTELPRGSSSFIIMDFSKNETALRNVQWKGRYLVVGGAPVSGKHGSPEPVYQVSVSGSEATVVKTLQLVVSRERSDNAEFWVQGRTIVQPVDSGKQIAIWAYPAGGNPLKLIASKGAEKFDTLGVAVSPAK